MKEKSRSSMNGLSRRTFVAGTGAAALGVTAAPALADLASGRALALAEERREELVELLSRMIRVRSQSGETAAEAQVLVKDYLGGLPYRIEESADRPSRYVDHPEFMPPNPAGDGPFTNVVGWPEQGDGSRFAIFSHIDTHIVEDGWVTDPYEPVIQGNRLYGLGTGDDKAGVAAMLVAAGALASVGGPAPVVMSLHGKGGGCRGSLPVFERIRKSGQKIEAVLYAHPAETGRGLDDIKNDVQGILDLELSVRGWRAPEMEINSTDSAPWEGGGSALQACWTALEHLRSTAFAGNPVNVGIMEGGDRIGSVPDAATARLRVKFSGSDTWSGLLEAARGELAALAGRLPASGGTFVLGIEPVGYRTNPGAADWDAPVSRVLRDAITDVTGKAPSAYPNHYAGDIRYPIRLLGVPAYGIGSLGGGFYGPNEWIDIDDLVRLVAVLIETMYGWSALQEPAIRSGQKKEALTM